MSTKHVVSFAVALVVVLAVSTSAFAEWEVTNLSCSAYGSWVHGVSQDQMVGARSMGPPGGSEAVLWSQGQRINLHPYGVSSSYAVGVSGGQQVGWVGSYSRRAALWSGTASSWVDLHPAGALESGALGVANGKQVGYIWLGDSYHSYTHAGMWSGTAGSWVDLHPTGASESIAHGVSGGQQVGNVDNRACIWSGTPGSCVYLGTGFSNAVAISDGQQVGWIGPNSNSHAGLWTGSAGSWVDLHPSGTQSSQAHGVSAGWQAGYVTPFGDAHASVWHGTASSWIDLHTLLPSQYRSSQAEAVYVSGRDIWVVGWAANWNPYRNEAIVWHNVIPEPSSLLALGSGLLALGGLIRRRR